MIFTKSLILFLVTCSGGSILFFTPSLPEKISKLLLTFGGSYMFSLALVHLLPEFFSASRSHFSGIYLLLGFYLQLFLAYIGHGAAHCHSHMPTNKIPKGGSTFLLVFALAIHSLLEGLLLGIDLKHLHGHHHHHHHHLTSNMLLLGIILHKLPASFSLTATLSHWKKKRRTIIGSLVTFSLMTPLSWVFSHYAQSYSSILVSHMHILAGLATGGLLHISSTILFESDTNHQLSLEKSGAIGLGAGTAILTGLIS